MVVGSGAGGSIAAAVLAETGARVAIVEEGRALHAPRLQHAGGVGLPEPSTRSTATARPTICRSSSCRGARSAAARRSTGRRRSARPSDAARSGRARTACAASTRRRWRRTSRPSSSGSSIGPGDEDDVNRNNRKLWDGATKLGWQPELIRRNVKGCARLGYCGMGCPLDAKQSALITYVPDAMAAGADLYTDCRARAGRDRPRPRARRRHRCARPRERSPARPPRRLRAARRRARRRRDQHAGAAPALARRQRQRPGRPAHVPAPDGAAGRVLRRADRGVLRTAAVGRRPPLRRSRRARRLLLRDRADSPDAGRAGLPGLRRRAPPSSNASPTRRRRSRCSSTATTTTSGGSVSVERRTAASSSPIRSARRSARPPSTPSPTWRACSWRPARARS